MAQWWRICLQVQETHVWSLGWEDPLEKGMATRCSILAWRSPWTEEPGRLHTVHRVAESWTWLSDQHFHSPHHQLLIGSPSRALFLDVLTYPRDDNDGPLPVSVDVIHSPPNSKLPHHFYIFISRHCRFLGTIYCKSSFNQIPLNQFIRLRVHST